MSIPRNYTDWQQCITKDCGIPLTQEYIRGRLEQLNKKDIFEVEKFRSLYGDNHWNKVIAWFERALKELSIRENIK